MEIEKYWMKHPDLRLGQVLGNIEIGYYNEDGEILERLHELDNSIAPAIWGSYGINGDEPLTYRPINKLSSSHIENILKTQDTISPKLRGYLFDELQSRK